MANMAGDGASGGMNWDAIPHQQLWEWFSDPKLESMESSAQSWRDEVAGYFQDAADSVDEAMRMSGVHWEGQAAEQMRLASAPLSEHALLAKDSAILVGDTTLGQLESAQTTARRMPEPKPVPTQQGLLDAAPGVLPTLFQDVSRQEGDARESEERARDVARTYDSNTADEVAALPTFEVAPAATVGQAEPDTGGMIDSDDYRDRSGSEGPGPGGQPGPTGGPGGPAGPVGGSPAPPPGGPSSGGTSTQGSTPAGGQLGPVPGPGPAGPVDTPRPTPAPVAGLVPGGPAGAGGPGGGRGSGAGPGGSRGPGGGPGSGGRAGGPGQGPGVRAGMPTEGPVSGRGGGPAGSGRAGAGMGGMAPGAAGRGQGDEDTERTSPDYLRDYHDTFWDEAPPVAPPVIGVDDD